jgi:NADP-dependent 3-hydroxy acid dehydrogenase YdfG
MPRQLTQSSAASISDWIEKRTQSWVRSNKVAFIAGAAPGSGRGQAPRLAEEGTDIIAVDLCGRVSTASSKAATDRDMAETIELVEGLGR